jgi:hypothetical protein
LAHSQAFSPLAWGLGLKSLSPDDARARDLIQNPEGRIITTDAVAPPWSAAEIEAWANEFHVIISSDPMTIKGGQRRGFAAIRNHLRLSGQWQEEELGRVNVPLPGGNIRKVTLMALRRR